MLHSPIAAWSMLLTVNIILCVSACVSVIQKQRTEKGQLHFIKAWPKQDCQRAERVNSVPFFEELPGNVSLQEVSGLKIGLGILLYQFMTVQKNHVG